MQTTRRIARQNQAELLIRGRNGKVLDREAGTRRSRRRWSWCLYAKDEQAKVRAGGAALTLSVRRRLPVASERASRTRFSGPTGRRK
jgi:hypothetical protein